MKINPQSLDISALPSMPLSDRHYLPLVSCIYFAMSSGAIQYIGRTINLQQRWSSHHQLKRLERESNIAWLEISDVSLLAEIESALIQWFKPPLNKEFTGLAELHTPVSGVLVRSSWKLRQIMADKKINGHELSKRLKVITGRETKPSTVSRWKQVDIMPKIDGIDLDALTQALGVDRDTLLGGKG